MHRFYLPPNEWNPDAPTLSGSAGHHARNVLRLKAGDKVVLFNGRGREIQGFLCRLLAGILELSERFSLHKKKCGP